MTWDQTDLKNIQLKMKTLWLKFTILQVHFWLWVFGNNQFSLFVSLSLTDHVIMSWVIRWIFFLHVKTFEQILPYFLCFQFKDFALVFCWKKDVWGFETYPIFSALQTPFLVEMFQNKYTKPQLFYGQKWSKVWSNNHCSFCSTFCIVFFYIFTSFFLNSCIKEQF